MQVLPNYHAVSNTISMNALARLTSKFRVTIPTRVRKVLGIKRGDMVAFEICDRVVTLRRATRTDTTFSKAVEVTLSEWHSQADERPYGDF